MENLEPRDWLLAGAVLIGIAFGVVGRLSGFCMRSALAEMAAQRPGKQAAAWLVAVATAVLGTQALALTEQVDLGASLYLSRELVWGGLILGGLMFGYGMTLARGCPARHLVLCASGNLRSFTVLASVGLSGYAALRGVLALPRTWIAGFSSAGIEAPDQGLVSLITAASGADTSMVRLALVTLVVATAIFALARIGWRSGVASGVASGVVVGLLVPAGWYVTGVLGFDEFEPARLESLTFTAPVGNAIQYLMTYTGASADFGIAVVAGVLSGAFLTALASHGLRAEGFDGPGPMARYLVGGVMMGFGGTLALGCSVGAGLTGVSTLSLGSLLAVSAIVAGGLLGLRRGARRQGVAQEGAGLGPVALS